MLNDYEWEYWDGTIWAPLAADYDGDNSLYMLTYDNIAWETYNMLQIRCTVDGGTQYDTITFVRVA